MVQTMDSPPFDLYAYQPPRSLWKLIEEYVPYHEKEEVKNMLGESLVDQSLELHDEINVLLDIWRDYREETTHMKPPVLLPEPRGLRDRLVQEIQFFVENVKEKAKGQGVNPEKLLSRHNQDVLEYALEGSRPGSARPSSRMMTARSLDGRETPMVTSPTCSDRVSAASTLSEEVESMNEKLTVLQFDEVCQHLRQSLEEEIETMKQDITFLQSCLDDEATFRAESQGTLSREPTIADLREERTILEKEMFSSMKTQTSPVIKPAFDPHAQMRKLVPPVGQDMKAKISHVKPSSQTLPPPKQGPIKAFSPPTSSPQGLNIETSSPRTESSLPQPPTSAGSKRQRTPTGIRSTSPARSNSSSRGNSHISTRAFSSASNPERPRSVGKHKTLPSEKSGDFQSDSSLYEDGDGMAVAHRGSPTLSKSSLGAVVTLTKDKEGHGSTTEVHLIPSPPNSAKPSATTPPRPGSAQRFRRMVLGCRE